MLAVWVNIIAVILGSLIGLFFHKWIKDEIMKHIFSGLALVVMLIAISTAIVTKDIMCVIISIVIGTFIGSATDIDGKLEKIGDVIKDKILKNKGNNSKFTEGFVTATLLFCVGSMAVIGSFQAGVDHNYDMIFAKSAIDFVAAIMLSATTGIGVMFSIFPILIYQGGLTLLANVVSPYLSSEMINEISAVGGVVLIGLAINMLELSDKKVKIANMLPAIFVPILFYAIKNLIF